MPPIILPIVLFVSVISAFRVSLWAYERFVSKAAAWTRFLVGSLLIAAVLALIIAFQLSIVPFMPVPHFPRIHFSISW